MDRYTSTRGKIYITAMAILFLLMIAAGVLTAIFMTGITRIILILFYLVVIAAEIWMLFGTYYEFGKEELICRCGPFSEKIPYEKIRSATKCKGYVFSLALSELRIEIKYGRADTDAVFISPIDEDNFIDALLERCPLMDVYEA